MLYVAVGENAQPETAQSLDNLFGKMLRINPDGSIPKNNPFFKRANGKNRAIWARGLRNPFSFDVQPGTGKIFINDVGAGTFEEINRGKAGVNYGWPRYEGPESDPKYQKPRFAYPHQGQPEDSGCAITGGAFYNPKSAQFPASYEGDYFFADFCNGWIRKLDSDGDGVEGFATGANQPVDLKVGKNGRLYYLERGSGSVFEVRYTG
jgi:glucose/arabinose dehydrogenase